jgi:protein SCO1/2
MASVPRGSSGGGNGKSEKPFTLIPLSSEQRLPQIAWLAAAAATFLGVASPASGAANPFDMYAPLVGIGDKVPDVRLVDQTGRRTSLADYRGNTVVITFIYTNCTDECPLISAKFRRLSGLLAGTRFHLVEVTLDPARDNVRAIARYGRHFGADPARWSILTGTQAELARFWRAMGESVIPGTRGDVIHNNRTIIVAADGTVADIIDEAAWTPSDLAAQVRHTAGEPSNPLARFDLALGKAVANVCGGFTSGRAGLLDLIATLLVLGGLGLALYLLGKRFFAVPG